MNVKLISFCLATGISAALCGCKSEPLPPKPYLSVPMFMAGQEIPADSQEKYLYNSSVKMYSVGRTVDPATGTMREAGTVYRVEQAPQWNLIPQYDADHESFARLQKQEAYGNVLAGQVASASAQSKEARAQVRALQQQNAALNKSLSELADSNAKLKADLQKRDEEMKKMVDNMKLLTTYVEKLERRIATSPQKVPSAPKSEKPNEFMNSGSGPVPVPVSETRRRGK